MRPEELKGGVLGERRGEEEEISSLEVEWGSRGKGVRGEERKKKSEIDEKKKNSFFVSIHPIPQTHRILPLHHHSNKPLLYPLLPLHKPATIV